MILNAMEKRLLFQIEGDCLAKVLNELHMVARYTKSPEQGDAAESLMAKLRPLTDAEGMDMVRDIQKNYRLPYPARTIGEKIAGVRKEQAHLIALIPDRGITRKHVKDDHVLYLRVKTFQGHDVMPL